MFLRSTELPSPMGEAAPSVILLYHGKENLEVNSAFAKGNSSNKLMG